MKHSGETHTNPVSPNATSVGWRLVQPTPIATPKQRNEPQLSVNCHRVPTFGAALEFSLSQYINMATWSVLKA